MGNGSSSSYQPTCWASHITGLFLKSGILGEHNGVAHRAMNCGHCRVARPVLGRDGLAMHYLYSGVQSASSRDCHSKSQEQQAMIRSLQNQQRSLRILL